MSVGNEVRKALEDGRLTKPKNCEECGVETRLNGHHEDYSKPLDIIWLCTQCHCKRRMHRINKMKKGINIAEQTGDDIYLKISGAAKILHVSPAWVYKRVKKGEIPHRRMGRMIRFHRKDIDELMDAHKTGKAGK